VRDPNMIRKLLGLAFTVLVGITIYTFVQIPQTEVYTAHRLTAPFEGAPEPTTLGGYLTLLLAVVMAMAIYEPARRKRIVWMALCVLVMIPILFTLSRTTYAMCAVMICLLGVVTRSYRLLIAALAIMILSPWLMPQQVVDRVLMTIDPSRLYGIDPSSTERIMVWKKFVYGLRHSPLIGFGIPQPIVDNQYVRTMLETGLAGLAAWGAIFWTCLAMGRRLHRGTQDPFHKALAAGYMVGTAALLVHALATITFYITRVMEPFWFLTGLVASLDAMSPSSDTDTSHDDAH
jgi:O-antigen ligase